MDDLLTSYGEAIQALFARTSGNIKPGLERTEALLAKLGSPHRSLSAIHVAGTNGKGSVVATCEALLRARGLKVGRYTSPHLVDFRERITVNGNPISEEDVLEFLQQWIPTAVDVGASFFEVTTALAFDWIAKQDVDIAVIETGLGGRLDSTNVLVPRVATVTSIGLDHTDLLGKTLEAIASEKAGIYKSGTPAIVGESAPDIRNLLAKCARDAGADPVIILDDEYAVTGVRVSTQGTAFTLAHNGTRQRITTPLVGEHQARNTAIAIATVTAVTGDVRARRSSSNNPTQGVVRPPDEISGALESVFLPGRFQREGSFIFDVAHNPAGARTVATTIAVLNPSRPRIALLAVLADKDWREMIRELAPVVDCFLFTNAPSAPADRRWEPAAALAFAKAQGLNADLEPDLDVALERIRKHEGTVLVTGSFHTVGDVMSRLQVSPFAA
ncbi:MAG TPA: folylpolyglutamate synthase/dihydrofolate synthase family protein [Gemmatimonadaceae bacterium]